MSFVYPALARHFNPFKNTMLFEAPIRSKSYVSEGYFRETSCEYLADLLVITPNDYATEVEVKHSIADWRADALKEKWKGGLPEWISRFFFAVPVELGVPEFVPPFAGVLHIIPSRYRHEHMTWPHVVVARAPKRLSKVKVPQKYKDYVLWRTYCRHWSTQMDRLYERERKLITASKAA